jgi:flotillin
MSNLIIWAVAIIILLAIVVAVFAWFFERATREVSLVRTGIGGRKVVMDGGVLAIPHFHEVSRVNMQTLRLEVQRVGEAALITKDRLRVDVGVEFYVSVISSEEGIAKALQTVGTRTFHADQLQELIEGKLVDSLRSVAARLTMDELHENRSSFVTEVRDNLGESLARNGLELDSVSLTDLDQTSFAALDENNAFNAVGMRKLAEVIAKSKKERAEIDSDSEVSVRRAAMEATKRKLLIELEEQEAEIAQVQEIETLKAAQLAEVAQRKADGERAAAHARIQMEQEIRAADIKRERFIREAEIAQVLELELRHQDSQIAIAVKSQEESKAQADVAATMINEIKAKEAISTAREIAEAERRKEISLLSSQQKAETDKIAAGERTRARIEDAEAHKIELLAQAEGQRALVDAENALTDQIVAMKTDLARLEAMPKLINRSGPFLPRDMDPF